MAKLILVRHGQSLWNLQNLFTGWINIPLSEKGIREAKSAATKLKSVQIDLAFTSTLIRAQETLAIIASKQKKTLFFPSQKKEWYTHFSIKPKSSLPTTISEKLNERYYGDLQGMNKNAARKKWGKEQVHLWRRSYDIAPPNGESLKDVVKRAVPYFTKVILPQLKKRKNIIIVAHGNSLRAIIKHIENISDEDIPNVELATGKPIVYEYQRGKLSKVK